MNPDEFSLLRKGTVSYIIISGYYLCMVSKKEARTMSNREMCISMINSMEEWQLSSVLELLRTMKNTIDELEAGAAATRELLSVPGMYEKLMEGKNTPLSECVPESEVDW